jgi:hypothetical protein
VDSQWYPRIIYVLTITIYVLSIWACIKAANLKEEVFFGVS